MDIPKDLPDLDQLLALYDQAAQDLLKVALSDGHFSTWNPEEVVWPASGTVAQPLGLEGLRQRARLITTIYEGIPPRRDSRLAEAHQRYTRALPSYHQANCVYLQLRRQFLARGAGNERDFLQLYQAVYLEALGREDPFPLDAGEAALVHVRVARAPLAHGQAVAEKLQKDVEVDDPRLDETYTCERNGRETAPTLRQALRQLAEEVVDFLAAGEHLAIRYNTFSNFIWLGIAIWKVITEVELLAVALEGKVRQAWCDKLRFYARLGQGMLLKFLQAHQEDPAQIKPKEYWYGQQYSYLTRDMIDLTSELVAGANRLRGQAGASCELPAVELPPLLRNQVSGRFLEYPHVGPSAKLPGWQRYWRLWRWIGLFRRGLRRKLQIQRAGLEEQARLEAAWENNSEWAVRSLELFGVEVRVVIDPHFAAVAKELELAKGGHKIIFFPTHQSLLDHPVMYQVLRSPELMAAMGWPKPVPCTQLARARLMEPAVVRFGKHRFSLIGVDAQQADRLLEEVDGYVILEHSQDTGNPTQRFAKLLEKRPGVVYGAGTTAAFALQCLPIQHGLFAQLPQDIVIIPMAFRGIHALWPKCPKGNLDLSPGLVEVVVSPPMLGETTLLPRKRALRTQLEPATLFQAVHIAALLNPEPRP
ncbi:MAG: hypothetical protein IT369_22065 [Candidatus Latescibacteria bacterium]|nr:hypothetical protein [Candidatus Latescibacterota bacterium]